MDSANGNLAEKVYFNGSDTPAWRGVFKNMTI